MITKMAPAYANNYMDAIVALFFSASPIRPCIYYRYVDKFIQIWLHANDSLTHFMEQTNNTHTKIEFTHESSKTTLPLLDVAFHIKQDKIITTLHIKPTDSHS